MLTPATLTRTVQIAGREYMLTPLTDEENGAGRPASPKAEFQVLEVAPTNRIPGMTHLEPRSDSLQPDGEEFIRKGQSRACTGCGREFKFHGRGRSNAAHGAGSGLTLAGRATPRSDTTVHRRSQSPRPVCRAPSWICSPRSASSQFGSIPARFAIARARA